MSFIKRSWIVFLLLLIAMSAFYVKLHDETRGFHRDELFWTAASYHYFDLFFIKRDLAHESWFNRNFNNFGIYNPTLGKYLIGFSLYLSEAPTQEEISRIETISAIRAKQDWESQALRPFSPATFTAARTPAMIAGLFSVLFLYLIILYLFHSDFFAFVASLCFLFQPLVLSLSTSAMMDMFMLMSGLGTLYFTLLFFHSLKKSQSFRFLSLPLLGLSIFAGLGTSVKLSYGIYFTVSLVWSGFFIIFSGKNRFRYAANLSLRYAFVIFAMWSIFIASNPFLYDRPLRGIERMFSLARRVKSINAPQARLRNPSQRFNYMTERATNGDGVFASYLSAAAVDKILILLGLLYSLILLCYPQHFLPYALLTLWGIFVILFYIFLIPFNWPRWLVPMLPVWAILEAQGIRLLSQLCSKLLSSFGGAMKVFLSPSRG